MRERKAERYASTEEIVKEVNAAGRNQYLCIVACVLVLLAGVYAALKSPLYDAACDRWAWATGKVPQKFEAEGIFYRITDEAERLETVTIGSGVRHIGYAAFENCKRLKRVVSRIPADSLFVIDNSAFNQIAEDCVLYVPRGAKKVYEQTFGWDRFDRIKEL